jgi:S-phase kinase-associated protein 1
MTSFTVPNSVSYRIDSSYSSENVLITLICPIQPNSNEKKEFKVDRETLHMSTTITDIIEDTLQTTITIPHITADIMEMVIEYCTMHKGETPDYEEDDIPVKDQVFCSKNGGGDDPSKAKYLQRLIEGANYLNVKPMFDLCCRTLAEMLEGKSTEEMRELLGLVDDLSEEQKAVIAEEKRWMGL